MDHPYRDPEAKDDEIGARPSEDGQMVFRPILMVQRENGELIAERGMSYDGYGWRPLSVWNGQRGGQASVTLGGVHSVLTRPMWNALKEAVEELFEAYEKAERERK